MSPDLIFGISMGLLILIMGYISSIPYKPSFKAGDVIVHVDEEKWEQRKFTIIEVGKSKYHVKDETGLDPSYNISYVDENYVLFKE